MRLVTPAEARERAQRLAHQFSKIYDRAFGITESVLPLEKIRPTQPHLDREKLSEVKRRLDSLASTPIIVIESSNGLYYILDGHHRAYLEWKRGTPVMRCLILVPEQPMVPGVQKTAERAGLKGFGDEKINSRQ